MRGDREADEFGERYSMGSLTSIIMPCEPCTLLPSGKKRKFESYRPPTFADGTTLNSAAIAVVVMLVSSSVKISV